MLARLPPAFPAVAEREVVGLADPVLTQAPGNQREITNAASV